LYQPEIVANLGKEDVRVGLRKADNNQDFVDSAEYLKTFMRDPKAKKVRESARLTPIKDVIWASI
jgi:hypothetical protein